MFRNYILIAVRSLLKHKVFILINVLGLGVAIACCIIAYLNWDFNSNYDKNHVNAATIYRVQCWQDYQHAKNRYAVAPTPLGDMIKQNISDVDKTVRYTTSGSNVRIGDEVFSTVFAYADSAFFDLFSYSLKSGSFSSFHNKSSILISDELARKYFNTEDVVGRQITQINHGKPKEFIIGGVFEVQPLNSSFAFDVIALWENYIDTASDAMNIDEDWKSMTTLFIQIEDASRVDAVVKQLQTYITPQNRSREDLQISEYYLQNFETLSASFYGDTWLNGEQLKWGFPPSVVLGPGIMAVFLLLLACFNFTNTSIAISGRRLKEIGIRKAMGSMRGQLILQFLGESVLICFVALLAGALIAELLAPAYSGLWPNMKLKIDYTGNISFFGFLFFLMLITAVIAGIYPAFYITAFKPVAVLKGKAKFGGTNWFTRTLLTFQFTISLVCVVMSIAFIRNAQYQRDYDLGYAKDGVIIVNIGNQNEFEAYRNALSVNRDITAIAGSGNHVSDKYYKGPVKYKSAEHQVEVVDIGDDYLKAMDIALLEGRDFIRDSENDQKESVLVSAAFVKKYGWTDSPIGKRLLWADTVQLYVVGVVNDILTDGFWKAAAPVMLRYVGPEKYTQLVASTSAENVPEVNTFMKEEWKKISPNTLYSGQYNDGNMWATQMINSNAVRVLGFLGFMAALMSATGLFALVSLNILKRMKEIGVRKVLGATAGNIVRVINSEFVIILVIASVLGGVSGYFATERMMDAIWEYYLRISGITLVIAIVSMFCVAAITVSYKTITAALINPVDTLKDE